MLSFYDSKEGHKHGIALLLYVVIECFDIQAVHICHVITAIRHDAGQICGHTERALDVLQDALAYGKHRRNVFS